MIYLHKDMEDIEYVLIYDCTTPVGVLKLPFKLSQCENIQAWNAWTEKYLKSWAEKYKHDFKNISAKAIKMYNWKELCDGRI